MSELFEAVGNMHMHTHYSDREKWHANIAEDAIKSGLDFIIVTDHNIWVDGVEVTAVGNSDAHGTPMNLGPFHRVIFPYEFLFRAVNTHVLLDRPFLTCIGNWNSRYITQALPRIRL